MTQQPDSDAQARATQCRHLRIYQEIEESARGRVEVWRCMKCGRQLVSRPAPQVVGAAVASPPTYASEAQGHLAAAIQGVQQAAEALARVVVDECPGAGLFELPGLKWTLDTLLSVRSSLRKSVEDAENLREKNQRTSPMQQAGAL